jgi:acetyl-CoA carboxylase carboxyltransferase component
LAKDLGMEEAIQKLRERRSQAKGAAGEQKISDLHQKGLLTARERIEALLDPGTFCEQYPFAETIGRDFGLDRKRYPGDGAIVGWGGIDGQRVYVTANDGLIMGGSGSSTHIRKLALTIDQAVKNGSPLIQLNDSSGGRIQEGADKTSYALSVFYSNVQASGVVPQITAIMGRCAGYAVYGAALTDFVFIVEGLGEMFITGPAIIREITGEEITFDKLGGARVCTQINGAADFLVANEQECFQQVRRLLSYFPPNYRELPPDRPSGDPEDRLVPELEDLVPSNPQRAYDIRRVIDKIVDGRDFMEAKPDFAKNIVTGFARLGGMSIGIVANQPMFMGGSLTVDSSDKSARFIRFCDAFNIPLLFLVDTPGYLPGVQQEHTGIIRHGAKLLYAFCESTVPKVAVVIRKSYGGGHWAMGGHNSHGTDIAYAWPTAEFAIMGAEQAAKLLYSRELKAAADPAALLQEKIREYRDLFANPYRLAQTMCIDDVIEPGETRLRLIKAFRSLKGKREEKFPRRHGNIPL